jgi:para-aminobenzoate synthetase component 1
MSASPTPESLLALVHDRPGAIALDGEGWKQRFVAWSPAEVVTGGSGWWQAVRAFPKTDLCAGYIGYGAGPTFDAFAPSRPTQEPPVWLARYPGWVAWDHRGECTIHGPDAFRDEARALLAQAAPLPTPADPEPTPSITVDRDDYLAAIRQILAWIADGECYQVNLARHVDVAAIPDPWPVWRRLRAKAQPRFGAYLRFAHNGAVLSASPELFLAHEAGNLYSLPIKGTRPRGRDADDDARLASELEGSEKDRAELSMIVDLVRNDLGRVADPGTVVWEPRRLFSTPYVHHAVQGVRARLAAERDLWDATAAAFPPGSVTGAPKIRACAKIAACEPEPRGVYCGAVGYVLGDAAVFNVAIRTAVWSAQSGGRIRYFVGGGIVADSDPEAEWDETEAKAAALASACGQATTRTTKYPSRTLSLLG